MLDLVERRPVWAEGLKPLNDGDIDKESFDDWWERVGSGLQLPPELAEEWVYRHWTRSPFAFLALDKLTVREELWTSENVVDRVVREWGITPNTDHDRRTFHGPWGPVSAAQFWKDGTWNIPMVVLETPEGFLGHDGPNAIARFVLVEGHQRYRYLHLKIAEGEPTGPHRMFILTYDP